MIQKITYPKIDVKKYDSCIQNACNYKLYAESWYLDIVSDKQWFCYVWNDYEAVMPVCYKQKLGIKYVIQPTFCQQLGVFYEEPISENIFQEFYKKLKKNIVKNYSFNDDNVLNFSLKGVERSNYILDLKPSYEEISQNFNQNTKRNLKKCTKYDLQCTRVESVENYIQFKKKNSIHLKQDVAEKLSQIVSSFLVENRARIYAISHEKRVISMAVFIKSNHQLYYFNGSNSAEGKETFASYFLMNKVIEEHSKQHLFLDFEGSNLPGVAQFFKGFGAEHKNYRTI